MERLNPRCRLDDAMVSEVLVRVAYRVIAIRYRNWGSVPVDPATWVLALSTQLHHDGFRALSTWLISCARDMRMYGVEVATWRDCVIRRAQRVQFNRRRGEPWKRVPPCY